MSRPTAKAQRRRWIRRLHLFAGLTLGVYLTVMGLTGALLVFGEELEPAVSPDRLTVAPGKAALSWDTQLADFREHYPDAPVSRIIVPAEPDHATLLWIGPWQGDMPIVSVDPYTGEVIGEQTLGGSLIGWTRYFHITLYAGMTGMLINGIVGLATLVHLATGLFLWWPATLKLLRRRLWVKWTSNAARRNWDLHHAIGAWTLPLLVLIVLTGAAFPFKKQLAALLPTSEPVPVAGEVEPLATPPSLQELVDAARAAVPGGTFAVLYSPLAPDRPLKALVFEPGGKDWYRYVMVTVDRGSGRVVEISSQQTSGDQILASLYPLHTGRFAGPWSKAVWVIVGLAPLTLLITGSAMTIRRQAGRRKLANQERRRRPARATPTPQATPGATAPITHYVYQGDD